MEQKEYMKLVCSMVSRDMSLSEEADGSVKYLPSFSGEIAKMLVKQRISEFVCKI